MAEGVATWIDGIEALASSVGVTLEDLADAAHEVARAMCLAGHAVTPVDALESLRERAGAEGRDPQVFRPTVLALATSWRARGEEAL